ncbi:MAG: secretin N-terminal domain-containing protein [Luteolibacter sp.]
MKPKRLSLVLLAATACAISARGQAPAGDPLIEQVPPVDNGTPPNFSAPPTAKTIPGEGPPSTVPGAPVDIVPVDPAAVPGSTGQPTGGNFAPLEQQKKDMEQSDEAYLIKDANLNDIFQFLAKKAGRQYFHNAKIATPDYRVTGHLNDGNPIQQMEELSFMYGLTLYTKGNTVYALTQAQLSQLPSAEFEYQLRYLRPTDLGNLKEIIKSTLSPAGVVSFEPKTSTVIIIDNAQKIEKARELLHQIDQPRGQVVVETKILRINTSAAQREGVDWRASLGEKGVPIEAVRSLNSVFGLPSTWDTKTIASTAGNSITAGDIPSATNNIVLSPIQLSGVLHALAEGNLASQISNPTLITEDSEQATISIIDRIPIVTATQSAGTGTTTATEEVRYKIDASDATIDKDPEHHREIGISIVVTPTLMPDGTIRMKLRPRSAQITENVKSALSGNVYPRVTESMVESLARVPDGSSLIVGGFYGESKKDDKTKVPLLGDIPVFNFFFKSKEQTKEQTSLVFIVTPTSYDPRSRSATSRRNTKIKSQVQLGVDTDWVDDLNPGPAHEPNIRRGVRDFQPYQAPYYPETTNTGATAPAPAPAPQAVDSKSSTVAPASAPSSDSSPRFSRARR